LLIRPLECEDLHEDKDLMLKLDPVDRDRIELYIKRLMTYEVVSDLITRIVRVYWRNPCPKTRLRKDFEKLTIAKVLQGRSWDSVASELNMSKGHAIQIMRDIIEEILRKISE
ncbi:MAG: hypothetical protein QXF50_03680, partial [Sulfolobales archaeon]